MRLQPLLLAIGALAAGTTIACGGDSPTPEPTQAPTATTEATATPDGTTELTAGKSLRSPDGSLSVRSTGGSPLRVLISPIDRVPKAPDGWTISGAYDVTARANGRDINELEAELELAFKAPKGQAIVVYHNGSDWVLVASERAADGTLIAKTDHLTPYAVAVPKAGSSPRQAEGFSPPPVTPPASLASRTPVAVPTARPSLPAATAIPRPSDVPSPERTPDPGGRTPGATLTAVAGGSDVTPGATLTAVSGNLPVTPGATLTAIAAGTPFAIPTVPEGSEAETQDALEAAVAKYKGRPAFVTSSSAYTATFIGSTTTTVYYGLYGGVNEVITTGPSSSASFEGQYTFLSEPRLEMPANSTDAQEQLAAIFPGMTGVVYTVEQESANSYIFTSSSADDRRVLGFTLLNGVPIAFMAVGTDSYYWLPAEVVAGL